MKKDAAWAWVPTLYFAEGLPYIAVMTLSLVLMTTKPHDFVMSRCSMIAEPV